MSKSISLDDDLYDKASELAAKDRVSVEEFVSNLLENRVAGSEYIDMRARKFDKVAFDRVLGQVPDIEPEEYDRL